MSAPMSFLAANWKMNPVTMGEAMNLARAVSKTARACAERVGVALFPPFPPCS